MSVEHVAVCIVGFRNPADIAACLQALDRSLHTDFEIVVCENGGPAACTELDRTLPTKLTGGQGVRLICATANLGYGGAVNLCIEASRDADAWWVLNPDTQPAVDAMAHMLRRLDAGDCDAVGSVLVDRDGSVHSAGFKWQLWLGKPSAFGNGASIADPLDSRRIERSLSFVSGASMMISRKFLERAGLMRDDYFLYCEECEWCLRGLKAGLRLGIAPEAIVYHAQGTTTGNYGGHTGAARLPVFLMQRNCLLLTWDLYPRRFAVVAAVQLPITLVRFGRKGAWRQIGYALAGWWDGVRRRRGPPAWLPN